MERRDFSDEEIKNAVSHVGLSMGRGAEITNLMKLRKEVRGSEQSEKALEPTDDSLSSPALDYSERIDPKENIVDFELRTESRNAKDILDYYVSAMAQQLSDIWPELLARAENDKNRVVILGKGREVDVGAGISQAIERLKEISFDERLADFLKVSVREVQKVLPKIIISW